MADSIPLPPFSAPYSVLTNGSLCYSRDQLRARDQEIVRCVLEASAKVADRYHTGDWYDEDATGSQVASELSAGIRALEFTHHE